jgi:glycosyltransferase involved in cell wall biosynthesis
MLVHFDYSIKTVYNNYMKKKVLFVITQSEQGGAQRFLELFLGSIDRTLFDVSVALGEAGQGDYLAKKLASLSIPIIKLKHLRRSPTMWHDLAAVKELRNLLIDTQPNTLFLLSSKAGFIGSLAARLARNKSLRVVYRIGGWTFNDPWPLWKRRIWIILERISAHWKDIIIVNSLSDFNQARALSIRPKGHVVYVPNGFDMFKYTPLAKDTARKFLSDVSKIDVTDPTIRLVGIVANFYPAKGVATAIDVANACRTDQSLRFVIIGGGLLRADIERKIQELKLNNVVLTGSIKRTEQYLPAFDVFLIPSLKEGFPNVLLEAMASKLPVIATRVGAIPDVIEDGKNGYLCKVGDIQTMRDRILKLIGNDRLRQEMGIQAHQTVLLKYPLTSVIKDVSTLL